MSQMTRFDEGRASELIKCGKVTRKDSEQRRWRAGGVGGGCGGGGDVDVDVGGGGNSCGANLESVLATFFPD